MRELFYRLLKHPGQAHHFVESRRHPGMMTCRTCQFRKWPGA
ncbi:MAG TPA: hypothetical protein VFF66_01835 [Brevundimonas sp.]|nr:hypothetical protein [Brevundimonas sp.]